MKWVAMLQPFQRMKQWAATDGATTYVITHDTGCDPDDRFFGRHALSRKTIGGKRQDIGVYNTLSEAKAAATPESSP